MAKKSTKTILTALRKAGVKLEDAEKVEELLDDLELSAEEFLGSDEIILSKDEHRELKDDLTKLRGRAKKAETRVEELQDAADAGDSDNARKAKQFKTRLDELEPMLEALKKSHVESWAAVAKDIPKELKSEFSFAEKDGDELTIKQLVGNLAKLQEYRRIGVLKGGDGAATGDDEPGDDEPGDGTPTQPRISTRQTKLKKYTKEELDKMTPAQKIEAGYIYDEKVRSHRDVVAPQPRDTDTA